MSAASPLPLSAPAYVQNFACIGGDCEDTCCAGWNVVVDEATYRALLGVRDPELARRISSRLVPNPDARGPSDFGRMRMEAAEHWHCPFLDEARLCRIQGGLGEGALPDGCATYPREVRRLGSRTEMALALSCPEAARLALLDPRAFEPVAREPALREGARVDVPPPPGLGVEGAEEARALALKVMAAREVPLARRMGVLGLLCERMTDLLEAGRAEALGHLVRGLGPLVESRAVFQALEGLRPRPELQARLFAHLFAFRPTWSRTPHQERVFTEVVRGLGADAEGRIRAEDLLARYHAGLERLEEALGRAPHVLEHYVQNEVWREAFPFGDDTPYLHFARLVVHFGLVRLMLAGRAADRPEPLDPREMAETVQVFCRAFQHDLGFARGAWEALEGAGGNRLEVLFSVL